VRALFEVQPARLGLGDFDTILAKALRKEPPERYQTVQALADDLGHYLRHEPVSARGDSLTYRIRKYVRRHRLGVAGAAALLETELRALSSDGHPFITVFARPFVVAGEWRLATGDTRGADSLADLAWKAALVDSLARTRSAYVGRTALLRGRIRLTLGDSAAARLTVRRALVALTNGYGPRNRWTLEARTLSDSLTP